MECPACGSEEVYKFVDEIFECGSCGEVNTLSVAVCATCGTFWKEFNGAPVEGTCLTKQDLSHMSKHIAEVLDKHEENSGKASMYDVVHKCIRCDSVAYDLGDGNFECPDCGFTWEIN